MSGECDKCGEHALECECKMKREFSEQKLLKLTSCLMVDYLKYHLDHSLELENLTFGDIAKYCREWIKENGVFKDDHI